MSTLVAPAPANAPRWPALIPLAVLAAPLALKLSGAPVNNAWIIFALLVGLMLTGMPISISLGLTVLTFLFTMTTVPIESVALKLFTGIEHFEIMAIPFFILAGNFLTHGGFPRKFGAGVVTPSGALGILIPPSIVMVMYAVATSTSIGKLFIAGIVPGLVFATMLGLTTWW